MPRKIGFLGTGRIAEPMVRSLLRRFPASRVVVSRRSESISGKLGGLPGVTVADNQTVLDHSETVFLCLLADVARRELPELRFRSDQQVISVMADISLAEVAQLVAPSVDPVVTVPLPFIESGGCPLPVHPASASLEELFGDENPVISIGEESAMGPHFAATAILSHTMKQLDVASHWLAQFTGSGEDAERYMIALVSGYLGAMEKDGKGRLREAMEDLSTEGGLNNQLRSHIADSGFYDVLVEGLDQLNQRFSTPNAE